MNGVIGLPGVKGDNGVGIPGPKGDRGVNGTDGIPGVRGADGSRGEKGDRGEIGQPGQSGSVGSPGTSGSPGVKGDAGVNGIPGQKGDRGVNGSKGEKGNTGPHGSPGAKGDHGLTGNKGSKGKRGDTGYSGSRGSTGAKGAKGEPGKDGLMWCNLGSHNVIETTVLSTKKSVILIKPDGEKTWRQAYNTCKSICGSLYFPSARIENKEVGALIKKHVGWSSIWLRISDEEREGHWKDPDNKERLTFTNWGSGQPDNNGGKEHWGYMNSDGYWWDTSDTRTHSHFVCELI